MKIVITLLTVIFGFSVFANKCVNELNNDKEVSFLGKYIVPPLADSHIQIHPIKNSLIKKGQVVNFLNWNIYKGKKEGLYQDLSLFLSKYDILTLQEILTNETKADHFYNTRFSHQWDLAISFYKKESYSTGVATASKFTPSYTELFRSIAKEPIVKTPKMSMAQTFDIEGSAEKLLIINIHAINFVHNQKFYSQLEPLAKIIRDHSGPVIFAGDFNTHNPWRTKKLNMLMEEIGMTKVLPEGDNRVMPLDHIFVKGIKVIHSELLSEISTSDHSPLSLQFIIE